MKSFFSVALGASILATMVLPSVSHALVREVIRCTTPGNQYQITVLNNEGTSVERSPRLTAFIKAADGVVLATYPVERLITIGPVSFTRPTFIDSATRGSAFKLAGPSTNASNYLYTAQTSVGVLGSDALNCPHFEY